jgi:hypothetical protein
MLKNPLSFTALLFIISFGIYAFVQMGGGLFPAGTDAVFDILVPDQFRSASSTGTTLGPSGSAEPSPFAGRARLASVAPGGEGYDGQVLIVNLEGRTMDMRGWTVAGSLGSQRVGDEGRNVERQLSLELTRPVFAQEDTARLYDADGRLVDSYAF